MASFFDFARSKGAPPHAASSRVDHLVLAERSSTELAALISGEVIPRMVALSRPPATVIDLAAQNPRISDRDVEETLPLVLALESDRLSEWIERLIARGVTVETLLIDLVPSLARRLGVLWEEDRCDFIEVTMGAWRLQELVHELGARRPHEVAGTADRRRALFATMPGDHHGLGTVVITEVFAGRGWRADRLSDVGVSDISRCLAADHYDLVGLTVSGECHIGPLPSVIRALRSVSINPRLIILVGGHAIGGDHARAVAAGADGAALDAGQAAELAARLVDAALAPHAGG